MRVSHLGRFSLIVLLLIGSNAVAQQQGPLPAPALKREVPQQQAPVPEGDQITVPAGTTIPLRLTQSISTKNARPGDPIFSQTTFPVTVNDRIIIPPGSYVQGVIDEVKRAGRVKGRAEILVHFRTLILPSGYTISLGGAVEGAPDNGSSKVKDKEGTVQESGQKGKDAETVAKTGGTGAAIGALSTGTLKGAAIGGGIGGAAGMIATLLTRGSDVELPSGTTVDMVLERPVTLQVNKLRRVSE